MFTHYGRLAIGGAFLFRAVTVAELVRHNSPAAMSTADPDPVGEIGGKSASSKSYCLSFTIFSRIFAAVG